MRALINGKQEVRTCVWMAAAGSAIEAKDWNTDRSTAMFISA
jgi:hypothetical protein